jgi:hypothetical protein
VHGPASAVWIVLLGVHVLGYLRRTLVKASADVFPVSRPAVRGARGRGYVVATAVIAGLVVGAATVPAQHHWVNLRRDHHHGDHRGDRTVLG